MVLSRFRSSYPCRGDSESRPSTANSSTRTSCPCSASMARLHVSLRYIAEDTRKQTPCANRGNEIGRRCVERHERGGTAGGSGGLECGSPTPLLSHAAPQGPDTERAYAALRAAAE